MNTRQLKPTDAAIAIEFVKKFHGREVPLDYTIRFLSNPANYLVIAEERQEIVGFITAYHIDRIEEQAPALFIYEIEVEEAHRRKGAGAALIQHLKQIADEKQMLEMFVLTNHSNTGAVAFYQATGGQIEEGDELMFVYPRTETHC